MRLLPARALLLTGLLAASVVACGGDEDGGSGPGAVAGSAGSSGKAGKSGTGGTGGTGGSTSGAGGSGGSGGKGGSAGNGGSAGKGGSGGSGGTAGKSGAAGSAGAAGKSGAAGQAGAAGGGGAAGEAGAAGSAGEAGSTSAGAAGNTSAGAAGNTSAGAAGESGAAGEAGAGGQAGAAGNGGAGGDPCTTVTVLDAEAVFGAGPDVSARTAPFGDTAPDVVRLRFATAPTKTTYTLTKLEDIGTAPQLVVALQDIDSAINASKVFFVAVAGTLTVSDVVTKQQTKGSLADVELREATELSGKATYVPNGRCLRIPAATWDTTQSCVDATNCGVGSSCDPETRKCTAQCAGGSPVACGADEFCGEQPAAGGGVVGACYGTCKTSVGGSCDGGTQTCVRQNLGGDGVCLGVAQTPAREGERCFGRSATFDTCEVGTVCADDDLGDPAAFVCRKTCKPLAGGCPASQVCATDGVCRASARGFDTQAAQNTFCATGKANCLIENGAAKGICSAGSGCKRVVFGQGDCPGGTTYLSFDSSAGYCF